MDAAKIEFLFGAVPEGLDPDDRLDREVMIAAQLKGIDEPEQSAMFRQKLHEVLAVQIADDHPPEVWETVQRLLGAGLGRQEVMTNLLMALAAAVEEARGDERPFDSGSYVETLRRLPVPTRIQVAEAMLEIVRARQPIPVDELESLTAASLGFDVDDPLLESVLDDFTEEEIGPHGLLTLVGEDLVVEPESFSSGVTLTHRLSEIEAATGVLLLSVDLVGFARTEPTSGMGGGELELFSEEEGVAAWGGPDGWLDRFSPGDLLAVAVDDGALAVEVLDTPPPVDQDLVAVVRAAYDRLVEELPGLPAVVEDVFFEALTVGRAHFSSPQAPLSQLLEAAGLEIRDGSVADDTQMWANAARSRRMGRVLSRLAQDDKGEAALDVLGCFDQDDMDVDHLKAAARAMTDPEIALVVAEELLDESEDPDVGNTVAVFAERLTGVAARPAEMAAARWLAALASEHDGDVVVAEAQLHLAVEADPLWKPGVDRLAWYLSDRGQAAEAARLWRRIGLTASRHQDLAMVEEFSKSVEAKVGRNEPCWCGSGRKYKHCHLGQTQTASLPDRVGWLCRKAAGFLERQGGEAEDLVFGLASIRAGSSDLAALQRAFGDALVIDLALTEGGWFESFLEDRGRLLPDDEALLAASWALVDRSLYEVLDVTPGSGLTVKDLRSAERIEVREKTFSRLASPGDVVCARAVPDGVGHQFVGAVLPVPAGREAQLLDLLDEGDPEAIAAYVASMEAPP